MIVTQLNNDDGDTDVVQSFQRDVSACTSGSSPPVDYVSAKPVDHCPLCNRKGGRWSFVNGESALATTSLISGKLGPTLTGGGASMWLTGMALDKAGDSVTNNPETFARGFERLRAVAGRAAPPLVKGGELPVPKESIDAVKSFGEGMAAAGAIISAVGTAASVFGSAVTAVGWVTSLLSDGRIASAYVEVEGETYVYGMDESQLAVFVKDHLSEFGGDGMFVICVQGTVIVDRTLNGLMASVSALGLASVGCTIYALSAGQ